MFRRQRQRPFQRVAPACLCLARQPENEIQVDIVKPGFARCRKGLPHILDRMDPAQKVQFRRLEALHAHAQAVDTQRSQHPKLGLIDRAGIGFAGDLGAGIHRKAAMHSPKDPLQLRRRQNGRCAAAHEDGAHRAAGQPWSPALHLDAERVHGCVVQRFQPGIGVEIAIWALACAEWDVNVQPERGRKAHRFSRRKP